MTCLALAMSLAEASHRSETFVTCVATRVLPSCVRSKSEPVIHQVVRETLRLSLWKGNKPDLPTISFYDWRQKTTSIGQPAQTADRVR